MKTLLKPNLVKLVASRTGIVAGARVAGTPVIVGKCPMKLRHAGIYVPGCPSHGIRLADGICEALGLDKAVVHEAIAVLHSAGD